MQKERMKTITVWLPVAFIDALKEKTRGLRVPYKHLIHEYIQNGLEGKYGD